MVKKKTIALNKWDVALVIRARGKNKGLEMVMPNIEPDQAVTDEMITIVTLATLLSQNNPSLERLMKKQWKALSNSIPD
jgi:hypothetical protein